MLKYQFIDTDQLIEQRCGMSVQQIFSTRGEAAFRTMEKEVARELGKGKRQVISTGGGMLLNHDNISALSSTGQVFCLLATPEEILRRVSNGKKTKRPLLESENPLQRIMNLIAEREPWYSQFQQIDTSGKSPQEIANYLSILM